MEKKISFSLGAKSKKASLSNKRKFEENDLKDLNDDKKTAITSMENGKFDGDQVEKKLVIPLKSSMSTSSTTTSMIIDKPPVKKDVKKDLGFGLVLMKEKTEIKQERLMDKPILARAEAKADYADDIHSRPDEVPIESETYEKIPVSEFGAALLRGMGWKDGEGIGRRKYDPVTVKDPEPRARNLGLGAQLPDVPELAKKLTERKK